MRKKEGKWKTLDGVLDEIWKMLNRGATHYHDPFHWPVLGTTGKEGTSMRCVILREFLMPDRILVCHTDLETEKGRQNFMAIACRIDSMDWLVLQVLGNRRARFEWDKTGLNAKWLIP
jgi:hypothetical protein